jgi:hypothetical protein
MREFLSKLNIWLAVIVIVSGFLIVATAKLVFSIIFGVAILIAGLNITGVLGSLLIKEDE